MKIILINNLYAPWARGGAERIVEKTVEGLEKQGHEVFVIATAPTGSRTPKVCYLKSIFYNLEKYSLATRFFWHLWDIFNLINYFKIKNILQEEKPDLVITHNLQGIGYLIPGLLRRMKIKHIHTLHDIQLLHPSGLMFWGKEKLLNSQHAKIYQALSRFLFGSPAAIISPSQWLLAEHEKRGFFINSKKIVLPNCFFAGHSPSRVLGINSGGNPELSHKNPDSRLHGNDKIKFLYVGQIEEHKGVKLLVEAFLKFLVENNSLVELIIIGNGSQLEEIKKIAGENKQIKILGRKNENEVVESMSSADCLVVPSLCYENSPTVIYEAIAAGLPVIGAKIGGITELLEAAGGILFEPGNQAGLTEKIKLIFTHPEESDRIRVKEAAYHASDYITKLLDL
jgi:glycosyltransferase involved in cell wall biosynthesis